MKYNLITIIYNPLSISNQEYNDLYSWLEYNDLLAWLISAYTAIMFSICRYGYVYFQD